MTKGSWLIDRDMWGKTSSLFLIALLQLPFILLMVCCACQQADSSRLAIELGNGSIDRIQMMTAAFGRLNNLGWFFPIPISLYLFAVRSQFLKFGKPKGKQPESGAAPAVITEQPLVVSAEPSSPVITEHVSAESSSPDYQTALVTESQPGSAPLAIETSNKPMVAKRWPSFLSISAIVQILILLACYYGLMVTRTLQYSCGSGDSYVDYQIVHQWLKESSIGFNSPEQLICVNSPFYLLSLALLASLKTGQELPALACLLNTFLSAIVLLGLHLLCRRTFQNGWQPLVACLVFTLSPSAIDAVPLGRETILITALIVVALCGLAFARPVVFSVTCGLIALARIEGLLFFICGALFDLLRGNRSRYRYWVGALLLVGFGYLAIFFLCKTIIPAEMLAFSKIFQWGADPSARAPAVILCQIGRETFAYLLTELLRMFDVLLGSLKPLEPHMLSQGWMAQTLSGLLSLLILGIWGRQQQALRFYFYICVSLLLYFSAMNSFNRSWYYAWFTLVPALSLAVLFGKLAMKSRSANVVAFKFIIVLTALNLLVYPLFVRKFVFLWDGERARVFAYKTVADFLNGGNAGFLRTIACTQPGALAYHLLGKTRVLDLRGVVSPSFLKYYPVPYCDYSRRGTYMSVPVPAVLQSKPDGVLLPDQIMDNGLTKDERFMKSYCLVRFWPSQSSDGRGLFLFVRADLLPKDFEDSSRNKVM